MFASLLRPKKSRVSETTPLLEALNKYRARHEEPSEPADDDDYPDDGLPYDGEVDDEVDDEDDDRRRDGPLLPVFSYEVLGQSPLLLRLPSLFQLR
jgi:hypothetical protein